MEELNETKTNMKVCYFSNYYFVFKFVTKFLCAKDEFSLKSSSISRTFANKDLEEFS